MGGHGIEKVSVPFLHDRRSDQSEHSKSVLQLGAQPPRGRVAIRGSILGRDPNYRLEKKWLEMKYAGLAPEMAPTRTGGGGWNRRDKLQWRNY
jgi:hypothetical protein